MKIAGKILVRLMLLAGIVCLINEVYTSTLWENDFKKHARLLTYLYEVEQKADVLYFGESSDFTSIDSDKRKLSISEFTAEYFPQLIFEPMNQPASHANIYAGLIKNMNPDARVKLLIVTMNLRSFNAGWINSDLESPLMKQTIFFTPRPPVINRVLLSLNYFDNKSPKQRDQDLQNSWKHEILHFPFDFPYNSIKEWDKAVANSDWGKSDGTRDDKKIELACHYVKAYAFQIDTFTNPRIKDFDEIVKLAKAKNIHLVFNLMAENVQYADSLVGKELLFLMNQNHDLLIKRYNKDGVIVVDNFNAVSGIDFIDQNWTTEHYKERGREAIARNLAQGMQPIYPDKYVNPPKIDSSYIPMVNQKAIKLDEK